MNLDTTSGPPDDPRMESRVAKLEAGVTAARIDVAVIKAHMATKGDIAGMATKSGISELRAELKVAIAEAKTTIIFWVVGSVFLAQLLPALLDRFSQ